MNFQDINVLIAEDYPLNAIVLIKMLTHLGAKFMHYEDGESLVLHYRNNRNYDLIFMDLEMPYLNGFEASDLIREFDVDIPIIACSAHCYDDIKNELNNSQMNGCLKKPYTIGELVDVIVRVC